MGGVSWGPGVVVGLGVVVTAAGVAGVVGFTPGGTGAGGDLAASSPVLHTELESHNIVSHANPG